MFLFYLSLLQVPFFSDDEETAGTPKADALFLPRENPRALVIRPAEQWPSKSSADKASAFKDTSPMHENGKELSWSSGILTVLCVCVFHIWFHSLFLVLPFMISGFSFWFIVSKRK